MNIFAYRVPSRLFPLSTSRQHLLSASISQREPAIVFSLQLFLLPLLMHKVIGVYLFVDFFIALEDSEHFLIEYAAFEHGVVAY